MFWRLLEFLGIRRRPAPAAPPTPGERFPYLREDPADPVDLEVVDAGLRFVTAAGPSATMPWKALRRVRLYCDITPPAGMLSNSGIHYRCAIAVKGRPDLVFASCHRGASGIVDDSEVYRHFVLALHQRMLTHAPRRIDLRVGRSWRWVLWQCLFDAPALTNRSDLQWVEPLTAISVVLLARLDKTMPAEYQAIRRNLPARYHPAHIPERALPPMEVPT